MRQLTFIAGGMESHPLEPVAKKYDVGTVVLRYTDLVSPLFAKLSQDPGWAVVQIGAKHAVFVRSTGPPRLGLPDLGVNTEGFASTAPATIHAISTGGLRHVSAHRS